MIQDAEEDLGERRMLIEKSARSLDTAREIFTRGDYDFAASRAYYAAFYAMLAALSTRGVKTSSHNGTASEFGRYFLKTKIFSKDLSKTISHLFRDRQRGDYDPGLSISEYDALEDIQAAKEIVEIIKKYLTDNKFL